MHGPWNAVVEMVKQLPLEKIYIVTKCFQERFMGQKEASKFTEDCETGVITKNGRGTKEMDQKLQGHCAHIGNVEVECVLHCSASGNRKNLRIGRNYMWDSLMEKLSALASDVHEFVSIR